MRLPLRRIGTLIAFAYGYGALVGLLALAWEVVFRGGPPAWPWWQLALAPFGIGAMAVAGEVLMPWLEATTGFGRRDASRGRRLWHLVILFAVLAVVLLGPVLYRLGHG